MHAVHRVRAGRVATVPRFRRSETRMGDLLTQVVRAHGGLERWERLTTVRASIVTGGDFWGMKGLVQDPSPREMTVSLHEESASVQPFGAPDQRTSFTPNRVAIEKL